VGRPERLAARIDHQHRVAGCGLAAIENIARENPRMAGSHSPGPFPADAHCVQVISVPPVAQALVPAGSETRLDLVIRRDESRRGRLRVCATETRNQKPETIQYISSS